MADEKEKEEKKEKEGDDSKGGDKDKEKDKEKGITDKLLDFMDQVIAGNKTDFEVMADMLAIIAEIYMSLFNAIINYITGEDKEKEKEDEKEKQKEKQKEKAASLDGDTKEKISELRKDMEKLHNITEKVVDMGEGKISKEELRQDIQQMDEVDDKKQFENAKEEKIDWNKPFFDEPEKKEEEPEKQEEEQEKQEEEPEKQEEEPEKDIDWNAVFNDEAEKQENEPEKKEDEAEKQAEEPEKQEEAKKEEERRKQEEEAKKEELEKKEEEPKPEKSEEELSKEMEDLKNELDSEGIDEEELNKEDPEFAKEIEENKRMVEESKKIAEAMEDLGIIRRREEEEKKKEEERRKQEEEAKKEEQEKKEEEPKQEKSEEDKEYEEIYEEVYGKQEEINFEDFQREVNSEKSDDIEINTGDPELDKKMKEVKADTDANKKNLDKMNKAFQQDVSDISEEELDALVNETETKTKKKEEPQKQKSSASKKANKDMDDYVKSIRGEENKTQKKDKKPVQSDRKKDIVSERIMNQTQNSERINDFENNFKKCGGSNSIESMVSFSNALTAPDSNVMESYLKGDSSFSQEIQKGRDISKNNGDNPNDMITSATKIAMGIEKLSHTFETSKNKDQGMLAGKMLDHMNKMVDSNPELKEAMGKIDHYAKNKEKYKGEGYMGSTMAKGEVSLRDIAINPKTNNISKRVTDVLMGQQMEAEYYAGKATKNLGRKAAKYGEDTEKKDKNLRDTMKKTKVSEKMRGDNVGDILTIMSGGPDKRVQLSKIVSREAQKIEENKQNQKNAMKTNKELQDFVDKYNSMSPEERLKFNEYRKKKRKEKEEREKEESKEKKTSASQNNKKKSSGMKK